MAGLRIAATTTVGLAALAIFAGAGGLGDQMASQKEFNSNIAVGGGAVRPDGGRPGRDPAAGPAPAHPVDAREDGMTLAFLGSLGDALQFIVTKQRGARRRAGRRQPAAAAAARAPADHGGLGGDRHGDRAAHRAVARPQRRGSFLVVSVTNAGRAVPSIGVVFLFFAALGAGFFNITLALVLLAIPPILLNAYTGVRARGPRGGRRRPRHGPDRQRRSCAGSSCRWRCRWSSAASRPRPSTSSPPPPSAPRPAW